MASKLERLCSLLEQAKELTPENWNLIRELTFEKNNEEFNCEFPALIGAKKQIYSKEYIKIGSIDNLSIDLCYWLFDSWTPRNISNIWSKKYKEFLFKVYINNYSIFSDSLYWFAWRVENELFEDLKSKIFFYDSLNSYYYFKGEHLQEFINTYRKFIDKVRSESADYLKQKKIEDLEKELAKLR